MGNLEGGPHGGVHVWTTDPTLDFQNPKSDMGVLASAAFDPVFFAHHANIDRIWTSGRTIHHSPWRSGQPGFGSAVFLFLRPGTELDVHPNNQMLESAGLRYRYSRHRRPQRPARVMARPGGAR